MTLPAAPTEAGNDKLIFTVEDQGSGTLVSAAFRAIARAVSSDGSNALAHLGVGTHADAAAWAAGGAVVLAAGHDGGSPGNVRKFLVDSTGRQVLRPLALYDSGGGTPAYAELRSVGNAAVAGLQAAWLGTATHKDGVTFSQGNDGVQVMAGVVQSGNAVKDIAVTTLGSLIVGTHIDAATFVQSTDPVVVLAGVVQSGNAVKDIATDSSGRLAVHDALVWTSSNHGHADVTGSARVALKGSATPARQVWIRADRTNAGTIYVGGATVTADETAATGGYQLGAGGDVRLDLGIGGDLATIYIHGTNGEGVSFLWLT